MEKNLLVSLISVIVIGIGIVVTILILTKDKIEEKFNERKRVKARKALRKEVHYTTKKIMEPYFKARIVVSEIWDIGSEEFKSIKEDIKKLGGKKVK